MKRLTAYRSLIAVCLLGSMTGFALAADGILDFSNTEAKAREYMGYYTSIKLTAAEEAIKKEALTPLPAACCSDNSAYTCCCPCNLSRTVWGLSNYLIREKKADAATVRAEVERWYETVNPDGFTGNACYSGGGCMKPFSEAGCGGMNPSRLVWGS